MAQGACLRDVASFLDVDISRVRALIREGELPVSSDGGRKVVTRAALLLYEHNVDRHPGRRLSQAKAWSMVKQVIALNATQADALRRRLRARACHEPLEPDHEALRAFSPSRFEVLGGADAVHRHRRRDNLPTDIYVRETDADRLRSELGAVRTDEYPTLVLHVVDDACWPFHPRQRYADPCVAWLDLEDRLWYPDAMHLARRLRRTSSAHRSSTSQTEGEQRAAAAGCDLEAYAEMLRGPWVRRDIADPIGAQMLFEMYGHPDDQPRAPSLLARLRAGTPIVERRRTT